MTRYVSFSLTLWLGWIGLLAVGLNAGVVRWRGVQAWFAGLVVVLVVLNGLHMTKQARDTALQATETSTRIREDWPAVDDKVLDEIYFGRAEIAKERLDMLHARGFAPFGAATAPSGSP